jgi:hypothetical protein
MRRFSDVKVSPSSGGWGLLAACSNSSTVPTLTGMVAQCAAERRADGVAVVIRRPTRCRGLPLGRVVRFLLNQP